MYGTMTRLALVVLAALLAVPAVASGRIIEIGETATPPAPSCPTSPCEVISRTTAFQARVDGKRRLFVSPAAGRIVAWSITLGTPGRKQRRYFEENLGGQAQAGITVMRTGERRYGRVTGRSPVETLTPYFGRTVQYPLANSIAINRGDVVALTVPTWAPALGLGLSRNTIWRASREPDACDDTQTQSAQADVFDLARYVCAYRTARVTYSATLITTPKPPKTQQQRRQRN